MTSTTTSVSKAAPNTTPSIQGYKPYSSSMALRNRYLGTSSSSVPSTAPKYTGSSIKSYPFSSIPVHSSSPATATTTTTSAGSAAPQPTATGTLVGIKTSAPTDSKTTDTPTGTQKNLLLLFLTFQHKCHSILFI